MNILKEYFRQEGEIATLLISYSIYTRLSIHVFCNTHMCIKNRYEVTENLAGVEILYSHEITHQRKISHKKNSYYPNTPGQDIYANQHRNFI